MPIQAPKIGVWGQFDPLNEEQYQRNLQKAHPCVETRHMTYRSLKSVHWHDLCVWLRNQKKKDKEPEQWNPNSGKLGICPDHPRCGIEMWFCMVGGLWVVVLTFKFDQNRLSGYRDFRSQNLGCCITLASGLCSPVLLYRRENWSQFI